MSYLSTDEGWVYLSVVMDLFSRKIVGWAVENHTRTSLASKAFWMAYLKRRPGKGLIHHSDRGTQYASINYRKILKETNVECSLSRKGDCWDNAVVESFFKTLKSECTYKKKYRTKEEARTLSSVGVNPSINYVIINRIFIIG